MRLLSSALQAPILPFSQTFNRLVSPTRASEDTRKIWFRIVWLTDYCEKRDGKHMQWLKPQKLKAIRLVTSVMENVSAVYTCDYRQCRCRGGESNCSSWSFTLIWMQLFIWLSLRHGLYKNS